MLLRTGLALALALSLVACSSEPLESAGDDDDTRAGSGGTSSTAGSGSGGGGRGGASNAGRGGTAGSAGTSSGSAGTATDIPDYTASPCYGQPGETEVYNLDTHEVRSVQATCRAEGNRTLFYVADDLWETEYTPGAPPFTQADVNFFMNYYELTGQPASSHPELGVLPTDELVFGSLDESGLTNGKLPIFLIDSGGAGQGYLCSWCDRTELHLDGPLLRSLRTDEALSIAAHETVHAIHKSYDANEVLWVDETLAEAAMTLNGYFTDGEWLDAFLNDPNQQWGPGLTEPQDFNYGAGLLLGTYLWERGGAALLGAITRDTTNDWAGIDDALSSVGDPEDSWNVFLDMAVATALDDPESGYEFRSFELAGKLKPVAVEAGASYDATILPYGLVYISLAPAARGVTIATTGDVSTRIALEGDPVEVVDVPAGRAFDFDRAARMLVLSAPEQTDFTLSTR
jgi:hypothetical protein